MKKIMTLALAALAVTLFGAAKFDDIPAEIKNIPADKMIKIDGTQFSLYLNGKKIKDADSTSDICLSWVPAGKDTFKLPIGFGVWDNGFKKNVCHSGTTKNIKLNEKFNWYKIGTGVIGKSSFIYITDWHITVPLKKYYKEGDANKYEFWLSAKFQGPAYVKDSKKPNAYIIDRAILIKK